MTTYRVHLLVEVTDTRQGDESYEWEAVASRIVRRLKSGAHKPLDRDARLRIQGVYLDEADDPDDAS